MTNGSENRPGEEARPARLLHPVDTVVSVIILAIVAWLYYETTQFDEVSSLFTQNIPPQMFPRILLVIIAILALIMPFEHIVLARSGKDIDKGRRKPIKGLTWITMAVLIVLVAFAEFLGTLLTMTSVCFIIPILWGERRLRYILPFCVIFPLLVALLFNHVLGVFFDPGILNIRLS